MLKFDREHMLNLNNPRIKGGLYLMSRDNQSRMRPRDNNSIFR